MAALSAVPSAPRGVARRLSFLDRYLTLWIVEVPVLIGLVNVSLRLRARFFPGEAVELARPPAGAAAAQGSAQRSP